MALKVGDEKVEFGKTFVYQGYGKWLEKNTSSATVEAQEALLAELQQKTEPANSQLINAVSLPLPTGAAIESKQLPDNHNVTVSNISTLAKEAKQLPDNHNVTVSNLSALATAAKQDLLLTELEKKADLTETQPVSLETLPVEIDANTNTLITIDYPHHEIHEGNHYLYTDSVEIDNAASQDYLITVPAAPTLTHMTYLASGSAITQIQLFENTDRNGTTLQTVYNNNRNSLNTAGLTVHKGTSGGTTDGTLIAQLKSGSASAQSRAGVTSERENEIIMKQGSKYILRITSGTNDNLTNLQLSWYELFV